mgnify:FL=1
MKLALLAVLGAAAVGALAFALLPKQTTPTVEAKSVHDFTVTTIDGKERKLSEFKGRVLLFVITASTCGLTGQYDGLEKLYKAHKEDGLVVLGFPANQFMNQEPGSNEEIAEFCKLNYGVSFPMFSKIDVKGENAAPLYRFLVNATDQKQDIEWNFAKFVVGKDGQVLARFKPQTQPDDKKLVATIESALK